MLGMANRARFPLIGRRLGFDEAIAAVVPEAGKFRAALRVAPPTEIGIDPTDLTAHSLV
jgi:hypothetical protein